MHKGGIELKYKEGNIVCLNDGRTVYILSVDNHEYQVIDTDNEEDMFIISESEIFMLLT